MFFIIYIHIHIHISEKLLLCPEKSGWVCWFSPSTESTQSPWLQTLSQLSDWTMGLPWVSFPSTHTHASDVHGAVCFTPRLSFPDSLTSLCLPSSKKLIPQSPSFMAPESEMVTVKTHHLERTKMTPTRVFPSLWEKHLQDKQIFWVLMACPLMEYFGCILLIKDTLSFLLKTRIGKNEGMKRTKNPSLPPMSVLPSRTAKGSFSLRPWCSSSVNHCSFDSVSEFSPCWCVWWRWKKNAWCQSCELSFI